MTEPTYFGWITEDGRQAVAVLRGLVLSPLRPAGTSAVSGPSWGRPGPEAQALARAVVADVLGAESDCPGCNGSACPACDGTGLDDLARELIGPFLSEVVAVLPRSGFELAASQVRSWIERRVGAAGDVSSATSSSFATPICPAA